MNLKEFNSLYNLNDAEIISIYNESDDLIIKASFSFYQEFIANGCRSDFDYEMVYFIRFIKASLEMPLSSPFVINSCDYIDNKLHLLINNQKIIINDCDVVVSKESV